MFAQSLAVRVLLVSSLAGIAGGAEVPISSSVDAQPLGANVERLLNALEMLGTPAGGPVAADLRAAIRDQDAARIQRTLDRHVLLAVSINPEFRVKAQRGPADARLQQGGWRPVIIKVVNDGGLARALHVTSPQAGTVFAGAQLSSLKRQQQTELLANENIEKRSDRFLEAELFTSPPMTEQLSGLPVEYLLLLLSASEPGQREATLAFDAGQGTQDLGFRAEVPVLFHVEPAVAVKLSIKDQDGSPTTAGFVFRDANGHVYPLQAKRTAPDFFFQPQVYRRDGDTVTLPRGKFRMQVGRGPEYVVEEREVLVSDWEGRETKIDIHLRRWVDPMSHGFYCGDHHIHGAGCAHYQFPTLGVTPADMKLQVQGEGLNVGCVLTWGPCFEFQRNYFSPQVDVLSEPLTVMKYDLEISGFGSAALGHVCLLDLKNQTYPGSDGTKDKGWPTWTVPVLKWCKDQGGVTGYPHSAMHVAPQPAMKRLFAACDKNQDGRLTAAETNDALLPEAYGTIDANRDAILTLEELTAAGERAADRLPNLVVPEMDGGGAMEICVSVAEGVCDFVSAMDTPRIPEWNTWYHLLNCGFPLKVAGETDFPCMSSRRVGQGRTYVQLGRIERIDFTQWCQGLKAGRSYVSDGYAHALEFRVNGVAPGEGEVSLDGAGEVEVTATVAFAEEQPLGVAYGTETPPQGRRMVGETRELLLPRNDGAVTGGERLVELVVNGEVAASVKAPADASEHDLKFTVPIARSSWVGLRQFPQLHTNPVNVIVGGRPIRASRDSAQWCIATIEQLWLRRHTRIAEPEREAARAAYDRAVARYRKIAEECDFPRDRN